MARDDTQQPVHYRLEASDVAAANRRKYKRNPQNHKKDFSYSKLKLKGISDAEFLTVYLHWLFRINFVFLFWLFCILYFTLAVYFAGIYAIAGNLDPQCVISGGNEFDASDNGFYDAFQLSWTTLSTVGYGAWYPALGFQNSRPMKCFWVSLTASIESFTGIVFAGFCGAILFGKILRSQSHASVKFSDPLLIRYGKGAIMEINEVVNNQEVGNGMDDGDNDDDFGFDLFYDDAIVGGNSNNKYMTRGGVFMTNKGAVSSNGIGSSATVATMIDDVGDDMDDDDDKHTNRHMYDDDGNVPFPILEFRVVNLLSDLVGGEIIDAHLNVVANVDSSNDLDNSLHGNFFNNNNNNNGSTSGIISGADGPVNRNGSMHSLHSITGIIGETLGRNGSMHSINGSKHRNLHARQASTGQSSYTTTPLSVTQRLAGKHEFLKVNLETQSHPFFKRVWVARHVLNADSPLLTYRAKRAIAENNGKWPATKYNNPRAIRECVQFNQILVSLGGVSNFSASDVHSTKIYDLRDVHVGFQFANMLYRDHNQNLCVDPDLLNDACEQWGGGGEGITAVNNRK